MDTREIARVMSPAEASELVGSPAGEIEPTPITPGTVLVCEGEPVAAYLPLAGAAAFRRAVMSIDCGNGVQRNSVYRSRSRTFGYSPRRIVTRRESCSLTALGRDQPDVEALLESYTDQFSAMLAEVDPEIVTRDQSRLEAILPEWKMGRDALWTSGVVNDTATLPYHRDGFNFPTWSAMPVVRRGVRGGHLHLPEFDVALPCMDSTVTLFPGKTYVHGVTPMTKVAPDGYRISVVYYALSGMKDCRTAAEETRTAQTRRTEREAAMAERLRNGDKTIPKGSVA